MKIYYEKSLWDFRNECCAYTCELIERLKDMGKLDEIETELKSAYIDGISAEHLDDLFRFDFGYVLSLIEMTEEKFCEMTNMGVYKESEEE